MSKKAKSLILHFVLIILVVITIIPFLWMVFSSFKTNSEITSITPTFLPKLFTFNNYVNVQKSFNFLRLFANSLFLSVAITAIVIYTSTISGFVFAKYKFRGKNLLFGLVLGTMMIPWCVTIIPRYSMMLDFKWLDSYLAIIIPAAVSGFGIFMMRQSISTIPNEMLEAARIDGASEWFIFHKIVFPLSQNVISSIAIFQFLWSWEDYLWPYLIISSEEKQVLSVGLKMFNGRYGTDYGGLFAATTISIIPVLIVYLIFQKRFIDGIAASSVKG
ncbi:sugar ABC transporter permease [Vallitalea longa]|uniref:Sugar ABC transporter permease n=1 Tax=Vallitalea longa TaxID=2936439 RepID=A0A9W6DFA6_9FIRM|nr:carbohydrate ABC transporter permease [Vallitalea longa]GKX29253.1 sugar ABC transporter permease [Vallitalea longa]